MNADHAVVSGQTGERLQQSGERNARSRPSAFSEHVTSNPTRMRARSIGSAERLARHRLARRLGRCSASIAARGVQVARRPDRESRRGASRRRWRRRIPERAGPQRSSPEAADHTREPRIARRRTRRRVPRKSSHIPARNSSVPGSCGIDVMSGRATGEPSAKAMASARRMSRAMSKRHAARIADAH